MGELQMTDTIYLRQMEDYLKDLESQGYSTYTTRRSYPAALKRAFREIVKENERRTATGQLPLLRTAPSRMKEPEAEFLVYTVFQRDAMQVAAMNGFLKSLKNPSISLVKYRPKKYTRQNADWLNTNANQDITVWEAAEGPIERMVVDLELHNALRRIECQRQLIEWFQEPKLSIMGKGSEPGKWRSIISHRQTKEVLAEILDYRRDELQDLNPPNNVLAQRLMRGSARCDKVFVPARGCMDSILNRVEAKARKVDGSIKFSHHTLRRTRGRFLWKAALHRCNMDQERAKNYLPAIQDYFGHNNINQTIKYLGLNLEDQVDLMQMVDEYETGRQLENPVLCRIGSLAR